MGKSVRDAMTANPCTIDADKPVAYAAKMMKQENVGIAPIVDGARRRRGQGPPDRHHA